MRYGRCVMNLAALNAAVAGKTKTEGISAFSELEVSKVYPNPQQPRKSFENIEELAQSIKKDGLLQPIAVVRKTDGYMIVSGERRYRATLHAELKTIKAHILQVDDAKVQELSLIENIQREDLSDLEKAHFIGKLWDSGLYAHKMDLAKAIGKSQSYISKALGVSTLDDEILQDEAIKDVGLEVLDSLRAVQDKDLRLELYKKKATVKEIRESAKSKKISSAKKFKYSTVLNDDNRHDVSNYLFDLPLDKVYKITIEEV
jgi:ParB family chromosome partitioning protein